MKKEKRLGIWMDHSNAHLIEFGGDNSTKTIESKFTHFEKERSFEKSESLMHNKEQHQQADYYNQLSEIIKGYDAVLLFGPTNAKEELYNHLKTDHHFDKIRITVRSADKMTDNQQHAFVREHYSKQFSKQFKI